MEESLVINPGEAGQGMVETPAHSWSTAKNTLAHRLTPGTYKTWIEPLKLHEVADGQVVLAGPNPFFLNWVKSHFVGELTEALAGAGFGTETTLEFVTDLEQIPPPVKRESAQLAVSSRPLEGLGAVRPLKADVKFTFDNFVVGDSNLYAFSAAKAMASGNSLGADALFFTSDHGLGKSHLSIALGRSFLKEQPQSQVYYLTAEDFTNEMTHALRNGTMEQFKVKYRQNCDILVLEEVQFLGGKEKIQSELCFTLDCLMERGKKVVFTSPQEPKGIPRLGRSLRSRLSTALVSPIGPPEFGTRLAILLKKSKSLGLKISSPVLEYLAECVTTDVRRLESCLLSLKAKSQLLSRQVDMDMAREALSHLFEETSEGGRMTPLSIRAIICRHFRVEESEVTSKDRTSKITEARSLGMYLSRQLTGRTLGEIGKVFGRTHSSALYAINKLEQSLKKDARLAGKIEYLSQQLLK